MPPDSIADPLSLVVLLVSLSLAPFLAIMVTSYIKIVVVLNLIRNALGVQQIPPNMVVNGLAIILSIYVMTPVAQETFTALQQQGLDKAKITQLNVDQMRAGWEVAKVPLQGFLKKHSTERERAFFVQTTKRIWSKEASDRVTAEDMMVLVPSFTVCELTSAFQIGFLLYLPFIAIDLVVANILLAMGMMMVSPVTISLPFKLLLFVLVDGWTQLIHGLVLTYA